MAAARTAGLAVLTEAVEASVRCLVREYPKVALVVVELVAVSMVHDFLREERAAEHTRGGDPVLVDAAVLAIALALSGAPLRIAAPLSGETRALALHLGVIETQ